MIELTKKQQNILAAKGHLLVKGGPGSGKTTVSILKAAELSEKCLMPEQKVLFLSFSRAAVARVIEAINSQGVSSAVKKNIDVDTYHSLFWRILRSHGYLIGLPRKLTVLTPPNEAIVLSGIRGEYGKEADLSEQKIREKKERENEEKGKVAYEEGRVCFDLFGEYVYQILEASEKIRTLLSEKYLYIVLDEFQDTNEIQWKVVQKFGEGSTLIALADPEQRIFDFIGAHPGRLIHYKERFKPDEIDLLDDNHRSGGTDIALFGNDVLTGVYSKENYDGVDFGCFLNQTDPALTKLITEVYAARKRLVDSGKPVWSLAVLVPTRRMARLVSEAFISPPANLTPIIHTAALDMEAAILSAEIIGFLMQNNSGSNTLERTVDLLRNYFRGKGGENPSKTNLKEADSLLQGLVKYTKMLGDKKRIPEANVLHKLNSVVQACLGMEFTGNPDKDWVSIRDVMKNGSCKRLQRVAEDAKNIRLLNRGTQLRAALAEDWVANGAYNNALTIIRQSFVEEHFSTKQRLENGVIVMNMHKAKGKQFDEVIIFEGWPIYRRRELLSNPDRIVRGNLNNHDLAPARQNFRVSVTRAREKTTILTPEIDPCILLVPH